MLRLRVAALLMLVTSGLGAPAGSEAPPTEGGRFVERAVRVDGIERRFVVWLPRARSTAGRRARTVSRRVARLPVWAFHGLRDGVVDPADTRRIVEGIRGERRRLGLDTTLARVTWYPEAGHGSWDAAFAEPELPDWILARSRTR